MHEATDRIELLQGITAIEFMPRLTAALGGPQLYIKRDDCTGLASGGNKARKLEYLIADAINQNADILVTIGGIQSNHARQTAAAAAKMGLNCELILEQVEGAPEQHYFDNGNILLDKILGAKCHICAPGESAHVIAEQRVQELKDLGHTPYLIPLGGSNPIGALGYKRCANEIIDQSDWTWDHIFLASGSAGTQAGLIVGFAEASCETPVTGVCVSRSTGDQVTFVNELLNEIDAVQALNWKQRTICNGGYVGPGYGIPTEAAIEAIKLTAISEGILLDPVYTGKAMAGLIDLIRSGQFNTDDRILFIHTGGSAGLFAYADQF